MADDRLEALELKISKFLRAGVLVAGLLLGVGWILSAATTAHPLDVLSHYAHLGLRQDFARAVDQGDWGRLVSYAGLTVLIALPFTRVVLTATLFVRQREWVLAGVAGFVAITLLVSVLLGIEL